MPQHIAKPNGPGDYSTFTPRNAATLWQALADESQSTWIQTTESDKRVRVTVENLPANAATVSRVSILILGAGDNSANARLVSRLAGVDDLSGALIVPLEGGYQQFLASYDRAPDGLPWTVAKRNAFQPGVDCLLGSSDPGNPLNVDLLRVATDYEPAVPSPTPTGEVVDIAFPSTATQDIAFPGISEVAFPSRGVVDVTVRKSS